MTISIDWANKLVLSTASITDLPVFHATLRDAEDDADGMLYPVTHTWKALDLGGGAFFYQADLINGYQLKFPNAGNYTITGNLNATIVPVAGVYVERKTSAAYITTAAGGGVVVPSAAEVAAAVGARVVDGGYTEDQLLRLMASILHGKVSGAGTTAERFRDLADTKDRVVVTVDVDGNRTAVVRDAA